MSQEMGDPIHYPNEGNDNCASVEESSFWFRYRNQKLLEVIERTSVQPTLSTLWEIGAGNGFVAGHLAGHGLETVAVEPMPRGAENCARRGLPTVRGRMEQLALPDSSLPAVGCFDVIEHLKSPEEFLGEVHRVLAPGGRLLLTVPALQFLWSQEDDFSGHQTRYTRGSLDSLVERCGFERIDSGYFMMCMVPLVFLLRTLPYLMGRRSSDEVLSERAKSHLSASGSGGVLDELLTLVLRLESKLAGLLNLPLGTSVYGVYAKR